MEAMRRRNREREDRDPDTGRQYTPIEQKLLQHMRNIQAGKHEQSFGISHAYSSHHIPDPGRFAPKLRDLAQLTTPHGVLKFGVKFVLGSVTNSIRRAACREFCGY